MTREVTVLHYCDLCEEEYTPGAQYEEESVFRVDYVDEGGEIFRAKELCGDCSDDLWKEVDKILKKV